MMVTVLAVCLLTAYVGPLVKFENFLLLGLQC